jgi:hypothetical protein
VLDNEDVDVGAQHPGGEQVEITLQAMPDAVPLAVPLRQLLKYARRSCRLRCLGVIDLPVDDRGGAGDRGSKRKLETDDGKETEDG